MESLGYVGHTQGSRRARLGDPSRLQTGCFDVEKRKVIGEEIHKLLRLDSSRSFTIPSG
jgi:hypothetical protein